MSWGELAGLVEVRPLSIPLTVGDKRASFSATWSSTTALLAREVRALRPRQVILEAAFTEGQLRLDGLPKATARPYHDGVILTLVGTPHGDLRYPCATFWRWQDNVRAIALALEALRKVDRYGVTKRGEQYAGWKALPMGSPGDEDLVEKGRRIVAEQYRGDVRRAQIDTHPDRGGTHERFVAVRAYVEARA